MLDSMQFSDGVITKSSGKSVPQTIDGLKRLISTGASLCSTSSITAA